MNIGRADLPKFFFRRGAGAVGGLRAARILIVLVSWLLMALRLPWHWVPFSPPAEVLAAEFCSEDLPEDADPPAVAVGERLFLETRFAQFFFANSNGDANAILSSGDPVMDTTAPQGCRAAGYARTLILLAAARYRNVKMASSPRRVILLRWLMRHWQDRVVSCFTSTANSPR